MSVQRDVRRGNQETQIKQQIRYSEDGGKWISGDGRKLDKPNSIDKETQRPEGIDRGDIRSIRHKGSSNFGLIKEIKELGGVFRDEYEFIPKTVRDTVKGDQSPEMWLYGEGKSSSASEGDRTHYYCKWTHREDGKSMEDSLVEKNRQRDQQISIDCPGSPTADTSETPDYRRKRPNLLFTEAEEIKSAENPSSLLLKKEKIQSYGLITNLTLRILLNEKGQNFPRQSMVAVIEDIAGKSPLSISVISTSTAQIFFKEEDLPSFQKLLNSKLIQLVDTKNTDFHQRDMTRLAHLYLSGYYTSLAYAAFQNLPDPLIATLVK
jgi:hypothetical protein